jgi:hypothetical protein
MEATFRPGRKYLFFAIWAIASLYFAWQLRHPPYSFNSRWTVLNLIVMLLCTITLLAWLPNPVPGEPADTPAKTGLFVLLLLVSIGGLFLIPFKILRGVLFFFPLIALAVLFLLKQPIHRREILYASVLGVLAGITGLGAGWISWITPATWGILQFVLVLTGLLAGWAILNHSGLRQNGVGTSRFLLLGIPAAIKAFLMGMLVALPWALMNVLLGGANGETWVRSWWQPVIAIQPGISEEAWARIFLVPLFFLLFRRAVRPRPAFTAALYVIAYWFAYMHTRGGLEGIPSAILLGTLYSLPVSYLCFYRDLETAIGWHFAVDFIKFVFAFILFNQT